MLIVVNHDALSCEDDFVEAVTGYTPGLGYSSKSLRASVPEIDAYVWLNSKAPKKPRILWRQNSFRDAIIDLLQPERS